MQRMILCTAAGGPVFSTAITETTATCHFTVFCGSVPLWAQLRSSDKDASTGTLEALKKIVAAIRRRVPKVKIVVRGDSGFAREAIMAWCEGQSDVFYLLGMARNRRLEQLAGGEALRVAA